MISLELCMCLRLFMGIGELTLLESMNYVDLGWLVKS